MDFFFILLFAQKSLLTNMVSVDVIIFVMCGIDFAQLWATCAENVLRPGRT